MSEDCAGDFFEHFGPHVVKPSVRIRNCKDEDPDHFDENWLPVYDDILCFEVSTSMPMEVTVTLTSTTFEGIAMNADHPWEVEDSLSDLVAMDGMVRMFPGVYTTLNTTISPEHPIEYHIKVLDYGAIGLFKAVSAEDPNVRDSVQIPHDPGRFLSNSDADSDGFTVFEEYRGFMECEGCYENDDHIGTNRGMSPQWADFFIDDQLGYLDWGAVSSVTGYNVWSAHDLPIYLSNSRAWLDFFSRLYVYQGEDYEANLLCEAGYNPRATWEGGGEIENADQAVCGLTRNDNLPPNTFGRTFQHPGGEGPLWRGPAGTFNPVQINIFACETQVEDFVWEYGLPGEGWLHDQVSAYFLTRVHLHELGHVLGIDHHTPYPPGTNGPHDCVMKYELVTDWPTTEFGWTQYNWGVGYLNDQWNCSQEKGLRP